MIDTYISNAEKAMLNRNLDGKSARLRGLAWAAIAVAQALVSWLDRH